MLRTTDRVREIKRNLTNWKYTRDLTTRALDFSKEGVLQSRTRRVTMKKSCCNFSVGLSPRNKQRTTQKQNVSVPSLFQRGSFSLECTAAKTRETYLHRGVSAYIYKR